MALVLALDSAQIPSIRWMPVLLHLRDPLHTETTATAQLLLGLAAASGAVALLQSRPRRLAIREIESVIGE